MVEQLSGTENAALLDKALEAALAFDDESTRASALTTVVRQLSSAENAALLDKVFEAALDIDSEKQAWVLAAVAGQLSGAENAALLDKVLEAALDIGDSEKQDQGAGRSCQTAERRRKRGVA